MTADQVPPAPRRLLGLLDWAALPEDGGARHELVEGVVIVAPRPLPRHQDALAAVLGALRAQVPAGLVALPELEVVIDAAGGDGPATVRVPDVVVARESVLDGRARAEPADVVAVVEVLSPGTRRTDRVAKLAEYAEIGIAHYVLVDPEGPITEFALTGGADGSGESDGTGGTGGTYALVAVHERVATLALGPTITLP